MGGWTASPFVGVPIEGRVRDMLAWRPNSLTGRYCAIGTHTNAYQFDGGAIVDITPIGFVPGRADSILGDGYGAGLYGVDEYGTPRGTSAQTLDASVWTFDMFGEVLLGCFSNDGIIYEYLVGTDSELTPIDNAPTARAICVSDERHVFAFGCDGNPNLVRWSDRENRDIWAPASTNRAGSYDMQATSAFQCGKRVRGMVLGWTATEVFGFAPLANSLVYSQERLSSQCGAISQHAVVVVTNDYGEAAYWMSQEAFFVYDGFVRKLPCELHDYIFNDINVLQSAKVQTRANSKFGEIWFFYCSASSNEIDRAVVYSFENNTWSKANISRLCWLDKGIFPLPIAIDENGTVYEHETGSTANGDPLPSYALSFPLVFGATGQRFTDISAFWPDMDALSGECALTVIGRDYPGGPDLVFGPYNFDPSIEKIDLAISTRQFQIKISGITGPWELGLPLLEVQGGSGR